VDSPQILRYLIKPNNPRPVLTILPGSHHDSSEDGSFEEDLAAEGMFSAVQLYEEEIRPQCSGSDQTSLCVDATLEETWHLITQQGYANAWPSIFGERNSSLTDAMDVARGGKFENIPNAYPSNAWYTYDDESCTYECMATEYIYWGVNAYVGALQNQGSRINDEWRFSTKQEFVDGDILLADLLRNTSLYRMPVEAPWGKYEAPKTCEGGVGHGSADRVILGGWMGLPWLLAYVSLYFST